MEQKLLVFLGSSRKGTKYILCKGTEAKSLWWLLANPAWLWGTNQKRDWGRYSNYWHQRLQPFSHIMLIPPIYPSQSNYITSYLWIELNSDEWLCDKRHWDNMEDLFCLYTYLPPWRRKNTFFSYASSSALHPPFTVNYQPLPNYRYYQPQWPLWSLEKGQKEHNALIKVHMAIDPQKAYKKTQMTKIQLFLEQLLGSSPLHICPGSGSAQSR